MARLLLLLVAGAFAFYLVLYAPSHALKAAPAVASTPIVQQAAASRLEAASQASTAMIKGVEQLQPQWETIQPKTKSECLQASGGALNPVFVRCHYGYQELVTYDSKGHRKVIQDRPIPVSGIPR